MGDTEPGGLLVHSLELVEGMAALANRCEPVVRECLLIAALFHDVGKVAPQVLDRTPYWRREHPLTNKLLLEDALSELRRQNDSAWSLLHYFLDVLAGAVDGNRIPEAKLLVALDQFSAAIDTRDREVAQAGAWERVVGLQPVNGGPRRLYFRPPGGRAIGMERALSDK